MTSEEIIERARTAAEEAYDIAYRAADNTHWDSQSIYAANAAISSLLVDLIEEKCLRLKVIPSGAITVAVPDAELEALLEIVNPGMLELLS